MEIDTDLVIKTFTAYKPEGLTRDELILNLENKLNNSQFLSDTLNLIRSDAPEYEPLTGGKRIIEELLSKV